MKKWRLSILVLPLIIVSAFFGCNLFSNKNVSVLAATDPGGLPDPEASLGIGDVRFNPTTSFEFGTLRGTAVINGMYIYRTPEVIADVRRFAPNARFEGTIMIPQNMVTQVSPYYEFTPVISVNGKWYDSKEYAKAFGRFDLQGASLADWFHIITESDGNGGIAYDSVCFWEMPINSPAGKYGVRARVLENNSYQVGGVNGVWVPKFDYKPEANGTSPTIDYYFAILYGEDVNEIRLFDNTAEQNNTHITGFRGRKDDVNIATNTGSMRMDTRSNGYHYTDIPHIEYGRLDAGQELYWNKDSATVKVMFNGEQTDAIDWAWVGTRIQFNVPANAPKGNYLLVVNHNVYKPTLVGTFLIVNGGDEFNNMTASTISGIVMVVIGLIGVFGGAGLVMGPRIAYVINSLRYKRIDDKKYGNDAASIRKREKERKELEEKIKKGEIKKSEVKKEGQSFTERLGEYRRMREDAKKQGISVTEYREMQRQQGYNSSKTQGGLATARKIMGDQIVMTENIDTENVAAKVKDTNIDEFQILDTVKRDTLTKTDQFTTVRGDVREEAIAPIAPIEKGILGRIRRGLEDTKLEKMDKDENSD